MELSSLPNPVVKIKSTLLRPNEIGSQEKADRDEQNA